jgi:arsenite methyltransferase
VKMPMWFWRVVCDPECSDVCHTSCPGCVALRPEWEAQGLEIPQADGLACGCTVGGEAELTRWQRYRRMAACFAGSATGRLVARLNPVSPFRGAPSPGTVKGEVQRYYSAQAQSATSSCGPACGCEPALPVQVSAVPLYSAQDRKQAPVEALMASLGCGNPLVHADLRPGEAVLDLGAGGGLDALVAAGRVGPDGRVWGLDMSEQMLALARSNAQRVGAGNVEFLKGDLEAIPLPDSSVDAIISNCVVNLAPDKKRAFAEMSRVLRPGGRIVLSDIVTDRPVPAKLKRNLTAWAACIGGSLSVQECQDLLAEAGFTDVVVERERVYTMADAEVAGLAPMLRQVGADAALACGYASASIRARRAVRAAVGSRHEGG